MQGESLTLCLILVITGNICFRKTCDRSEDAVLQCILYNKLGLLKINVYIYITSIPILWGFETKFNCYIGLSLFLFLTLLVIQSSYSGQQPPAYIFMNRKICLFYVILFRKVLWWVLRTAYTFVMINCLLNWNLFLRNLIQIAMKKLLL